MNEIQKKLLDILIWFDSFTRKHNLKYYALGGTMLGAYRHRGFIPWDDDIDVGMPREDYEKFVELMKTSEQDRFVLETPYSTDKKYLYSVSKLFDTNTTVIEKTRQKLVRGLWLDILVLDGMGRSKEEATEFIKKITRLNYLLVTRRAIVRKQRSFLKNCAILFSRLVPDFIFRPKKIQHKIEELRKIYSWNDSLYGGNTIGYAEKEIIPITVWGKPTEYDFEGISIYGVEKPDEYLTSLFGDWRKLPPENKRYSGHDFLKIEFEKPYISKKEKE